MEVNFLISSHTKVQILSSEILTARLGHHIFVHFFPVHLSVRTSYMNRMYVNRFLVPVQYLNKHPWE